uniref:ATP synthase subunit d, mitochondrial n=1 Tax=Parascaris univalens TaxID=6257 RepID=A0A915BDD6_PARUN
LYQRFQLSEVFSEAPKMATSAKRVMKAAVNWKQLTDKLTPQYVTELSALKSQYSHFFGLVVTLPADLPKYDFEALKKQMPAHTAVLDSLQKQYESLKIPFGEIPGAHLKEIDEWMDYNNERIKLHEMKAADGAVEAQKVEEKWARAPPVEHFSREHFVEYFPQQFYDLRYQDRVPDPCNLGLNDTDIIQQRFKDYKVLRRPDKEDSH